MNDDRVACFWIFVGLPLVMTLWVLVIATLATVLIGMVL